MMVLLQNQFIVPFNLRKFYDRSGEREKVWIETNENQFRKLRASSPTVFFSDHLPQRGYPGRKVTCGFICHTFQKPLCICAFPHTELWILCLTQGFLYSLFTQYSKEQKSLAVLEENRSPGLAERRGVSDTVTPVHSQAMFKHNQHLTGFWHLLPS